MPHRAAGVDARIPVASAYSAATEILPLSLDPRFVRASRRRDLLLTLVMLGIAATPAWLLPTWLGLPWLAVVLILGVPGVYFSWRYAPWVPTPAAELPRILAALDLGPQDRFCDLGAGDGRMLLRIHAATGAPCTGIEVSPFQVAAARLRLAIQGGPGTRLVWGDVQSVDLSAFDALYVWGTAYWVGTPKFAAHMREALRPGARLVSYHYPLSGIEPDRVDTDGQRPLYVYVAPLRAVD